MKRACAVAAILLVAITPVIAAGPAISGEYVEARTAEIFTGGCIMASEAQTMGKQAVLAWKVDRGAFNGVPLDGLAVVAAVAGDRNLGIVEIGGGKANVRSAVFVDARATSEQQAALVAMATELAKGTVSNIVQVKPVAIAFSSDVHAASVTTDHVTLSVEKHMHHDPSCGAMQWFHPFVSSAQTAMGVAVEHKFSGSSLGTKWSHPDKRSAFFGRFSY